MHPLCDQDGMFQEWTDALEAATGGLARFSVRPDEDLLPAALAGARLGIVGASGGGAFPGVVFIVLLRRGLTPWQFFERFHTTIAAVLRTCLPRRVTWRLLFQQGKDLLAVARIGYSRVGESLLRPSNPEDSTVEANTSDNSLVDDLTALVMRLIEETFNLRPNERERNRFRAGLVHKLASLPYGRGTVIDEDMIRRFMVKIDSLTKKVNDLATTRHEPTTHSRPT